MTNVGLKLISLTKNEDLENLKELFNTHKAIIPLLRIFIEEAFKDALNFKFFFFNFYSTKIWNSLLKQIYIY